MNVLLNLLISSFDYPYYGLITYIYIHHLRCCFGKCDGMVGGNYQPRLKLSKKHCSLDANSFLLWTYAFHLWSCATISYVLFTSSLVSVSHFSRYSVMHDMISLYPFLTFPSLVVCFAVANFASSQLAYLIRSLWEVLSGPKPFLIHH